LITIIQILEVLLNVLWWIVIIDVVLSILISFNVVNTYNSFVRSVYDALERLCQPLYAPIRRILPTAGGVDFSPAIVLLVIYILMQIVLPNIAASFSPAPPL
jgi:YggT family protein